MIKCSECGVYFFTISGRKEHTRYCIGYNPTPDARIDDEFMTALDRMET